MCITILSLACFFLGECRAVEALRQMSGRTAEKAELLIFPHLPRVGLGWPHFIFVTKGGEFKVGLPFRIPAHFNRCPVKASEVQAAATYFHPIFSYEHFICRPPNILVTLFILHKYIAFVYCIAIGQ